MSMGLHLQLYTQDLKIAHPSGSCQGVFPAETTICIETTTKTEK